MFTDSFKKVLELDKENKTAKKYIEIAKNKLEIESKPEDADAYYNKGLVAYAGGDFEEAVELWEMCLRVEPDHQRAKKSLEKVRKVIVGGEPE